MKTKALLLIALFFCTFRLGAEDKPSSKSTAAEKELMDTIGHRINYGDKQALTEAAKMRPSIAIPYLAHYTLDRSTDPERAEIARATLAKIPGLENYFRPILVVPPKEDFRVFGKRIDAFDVLARLKTREAIRIVASSLFDEAVMHPDLPEDVLGGGPVKLLAAMSLGKMNLPDAPTTREWGRYRIEEVELWRAWWTANKDKYQKE